MTQTLLRIDKQCGLFAIDNTLVAVLHGYYEEEAALTDPDAITAELKRIGVWERLLAAMAEFASCHIRLKRTRTWQTLHLHYVPECGWSQREYHERENIGDPDPTRGVVLSFTAR